MQNKGNWVLSWSGDIQIVILVGAREGFLIYFSGGGYISGGYRRKPMNGIWYGIDSRRNRIFTSRNPNREIPWYLIGKYDDKMDVLPKPWNDPIVVSSIVYDGDGLETILNSCCFSANPFCPEMKAKSSKPDWDQGLLNISVPNALGITPRTFPDLVLFI